MRKSEIPAAFSAALQLHQGGDLARAEVLYRQIVDLQRNHADAIHFLGMLLHQTDRRVEAMPLLAKSLQLTPANPVFHDNMVVVYQSLKQPDKALDHAQISARLNPNNSLAHYNLGVALAAVGNTAAAAAAYERAIALRPGNAQAINNLADMLLTLDRAPEAETMARSAMGLMPQSAEPLHNLGRALKLLNRPDEAIAAFERSIELKPDYASAWNNLGALHQDLGELDDALRCYAQAEASRPDFAAAGSNRLMVMNFQDGVLDADLFEALVAWARRYAPEPADPKRFDQDRDANRRLRIGYVSADFRQHSVATFLEPLIANHDGDEVEVTCYSDVAHPDAVTARFQSCAHRWRSISRLSDEQAESMIRQDGIDILIDLAGHTGEHRLTLFARRPAPVQVSYLGWQNTTGMRAIACRITDALVDPPAVSDAFHTETLIRLPETFAVYRPPEQMPQVVSPLPALANRFVTFGSFAKLDKTTPAMLRLWGRVLARVADSRLMIVAGGLHSARARQRVLAAVCEGGASADRVELVGAVPFVDYLKLHDRIDVCLDTFPFNGHTTTCHGLWMGVPIVTLTGMRYASRMGLSVMRNLDLTQFIAESPEGYVERAVAAARDLQALAQLRAGMRERMRTSPLMEVSRFARHFEAALRATWSQWCAARADTR